MPTAGRASLRKKMGSPTPGSPRFPRRARFPNKSTPCSTSRSRSWISRSPSCRKERSARPAGIPAPAVAGGKGRGHEAAGPRRGAKAAPPEGQHPEGRRQRDGRRRRRLHRPVRGIDLAGRERRVRFDIAFEIVEWRVEAGTKVCPHCGNRTSERVPDGMPGPLQHGADLHAFTVELPVERMLSQRRAIGAVRAVLALGSWKPPALAMSGAFTVRSGCGRKPPPNAGRNRRVHIVTDQQLTLKFPHDRRGGEAIGDIGVASRCASVPAHDCWASNFACGRCARVLCGAHLLREPAYTVESSELRSAQLMKPLLPETCRAVNANDGKALAEAEFHALRRRCRTILAQGARELPAIPRAKGRRRLVAKPDAHSSHERLAKRKEARKRSAEDPDAVFTNNTADQATRLARARVGGPGASGPGPAPGHGAASRAALTP